MMKNEALAKLAEIRGEYENKKHSVSEWFAGINDDEHIQIIMDYCDDNGYKRPYYMSEFDKMMEGKTPTEIVDMVGNDFNTNDDFFWFDAYGYAESGCTSLVFTDFGDINENWLLDNAHKYDSFSDFNDELDNMVNEYYGIIEYLKAAGEDVKDIPDLD